MESRRGRLVRPLLEVTREEVREYLRARYLQWREDPSNADARFARARVRHEVITALRQLNPKAEQAIAETARQLREEAEILDINTSDALEAVGGGPAVPLAALDQLPVGLRRLVLRRLAEVAVGEPRSLSRREAEAVAALGREGTKAWTSAAACGRWPSTERSDSRSRARTPSRPAPVRASGARQRALRRLGGGGVAGGRGEVAVSAAAVGHRLTVRAWRDGDQMQPLGLGGTKSLQDLFTDRKVPRELRSELPVVETGDAIVWVAGVAVDERFAATEGDEAAVGLSARPAS